MTQTTENMKKWRQNIKEYCIQIMGTKCQSCGYNKCNRALEFHHINPNSKKSKVSFKQSGFEKIIEELKKCVLLCSNCHRETHEYNLSHKTSFNKIKAEKYLLSYKNDIKTKNAKVNWENIDLIQMKKQKYSNKQIANIFRVSETAIRKKLKKVMRD